MSSEQLTRERGCLPCAIANSVVGFAVGWLPVAAAFVKGSSALVALSLVWALAVTGYTAYRLLALGHLPYAEATAKRVGLHDRFGPKSEREGGTESQSPDE